jgi:hypothetical protein
VVLVLAWIAWAIHVGSDHGSRAALGVLIACPALLVAAAIVSPPFIGGYRLVRGLSGSDEEGDSSGATVEQEKPGDEDEDSGDVEEETEEESDDDEAESDSDSEAEASAKS